MSCLLLGIFIPTNLFFVYNSSVESDVSIGRKSAYLSKHCRFVGLQREGSISILGEPAHRTSIKLVSLPNVGAYFRLSFPETIDIPTSEIS